MKNSSKKMYETAKTKFEDGESDQGIRILEDIITKDPDYLLAYCSLGRAYVDKGEYHKAENILLRAVRLSPKWHLPHLHLGWLYEKKQEFPQAQAAYERAVKLKPDDFDSRAYLGYMYQRLDDQEAAVKQLQAGYQLNPYDITLLYHLVRSLLSLNQAPNALELLNEAFATSAKFDTQSVAYLYQLRGITFFNLGQLDHAEADIQKAIEINPDESQFYIDLGDVYYEKDQNEEAINSYKQALSSESEKGRALKSIGFSYLSLENWQATVNALEKARELGETVFYGLGFAYFELGDDEQGIENLKKEILNNGPAKIEASYYLGFAYAAVGDRVSSVEAFKQFLELSARVADKPEWREWRAEAKKQIEEQG